MTKYKITEKQIKKMIEFGKNFSDIPNQKNAEYSFYYTNLTPKDVYVRYNSYFLCEDGSIGSISEIQCIDGNGEMRDCAEQFKTVQEKMLFINDFIELTLDDMEVVKFK